MSGRALAVLKRPHSVPELVTFAAGVVRAMGKSAWFASPTPPLAQVQAAIDALHAAEIEARTLERGAVALRNEKKVALVALLEQVRSYVEALARANPGTARSIIEGAGIGVKRAMVRTARGLRVRPGRAPGSVELRAPSAGDRAAYEWMVSVDGGNAWTRLPTTTRARAEVTGLGPVARVLVRYRALTKAGAGDWSAAASIRGSVT